MRVWINWAAACLVVFVVPHPVFSQTLAQASGPANQPPAGFSGRSFVDAEGCVYIRAGRAGTVSWVPQVTRNARLVCGFQPTFATAPSQPTQRAAAIQAREAAAPIAQVAASVSTPVQQSYNPPKGYVTVWKDGRLNPNRGPRSAKGDKQMAAVWTNDVPMKMRAVSTKTSVPMVTKDARQRRSSVADVVGTLKNKYLLSTKSPDTPILAQAEAGRFIQVGTFAQSANAARAVTHVRALGFLAKREATTLGGQAVSVVLAGPVLPGQAANVRAKMRAAGYADAFVR